MNLLHQMLIVILEILIIFIEANFSMKDAKHYFWLIIHFYFFDYFHFCKLQPFHISFIKDNQVNLDISLFKRDIQKYFENSLHIRCIIDLEMDQSIKNFCLYNLLFSFHVIKYFKLLYFEVIL